MPIKYDPGERKYHIDHEHLSPELGKRVVDDTLKLVRALGYDMNSLEWAIRDGVPYAIDFMNPAPDMDIYSLTPFYFEWAVKHMADLAIRLAKNPRPQSTNLRWETFFTDSRVQGGAMTSDKEHARYIVPDGTRKGQSCSHTKYHGRTDARKGPPATSSPLRPLASDCGRFIA